MQCDQVINSNVVDEKERDEMIDKSTKEPNANSIVSPVELENRLEKTNEGEETCISQTSLEDNIFTDDSPHDKVLPQKRNRPRRAATLKTKSYTQSTESDEDEAKFIFQTNTLNCVMCTKSFSELVELESHVRSHDEVVHFSLVLKSRVSSHII